MDDREELLSKLDERIKFGEELIAQLHEVQGIDGVPKLQRKIRQEVEFLKKVRSLTLKVLSEAIYYLPTTHRPYYFSCKEQEMLSGNICLVRTFGISRPWWSVAEDPG